MRLDVLYFNQFCKGKYTEKENQAKEKYHGFRIQEYGLEVSHRNYVASQEREYFWNGRQHSKSHRHPKKKKREKLQEPFLIYYYKYRLNILNSLDYSLGWPNNIFFFFLIELIN